MPRQPRNFSIGGYYHIFNRGVDRRKIFLTNQDRHRFVLALEFFNSDAPAKLWSLLSSKAGSDPALLLGERLALERAKKSKNRLVDLCAFALMPNHYHLILHEIKEGGISEFMKKLGGYSSYFNKQHDRSGSLVQARYKMVPLVSDSQLSIALSYVHTNPIELVEPLWKSEAKVTNLESALRQLNTYTFSSYHDYIGRPTFPHVTQREPLAFLLREWGHNVQQETEKWIRYKAQRALGVQEMPPLSGV